VLDRRVRNCIGGLLIRMDGVMRAHVECEGKRIVSISTAMLVALWRAPREAL
jgi:uncharacterized protein YrrD